MFTLKHFNLQKTKSRNLAWNEGYNVTITGIMKWLEEIVQITVSPVCQ